MTLTDTQSHSNYMHKFLLVDNIINATHATVLETVITTCRIVEMTVTNHEQLCRWCVQFEITE